MKVLFTGFTSRTIGSDRNVYDYMSNVFVLEQALRLAGHDVTTRAVSLMEDPCIEEEFDAAIVGIAACQGLSSRFKLGACWALHKFGSRAGIFPSDGKNIYVFPSSVRTCLTGDHYDKVLGRNIDALDYFLGQLQQDKNNIVDVELGREMKDVWKSVLERLPHEDRNSKCAWPMLVPTHAWGDGRVYARHFGANVTTWDPTHVAIPMQYPAGSLGEDGRMICPTCLVPGSGIMSTGSEMDECFCRRPRKREWVVSSLQDQAAWIKKQKCKWPVITVGNKRKARQGEGVDYIPEMQMIKEYYAQYWGHLAFGYPMADGGWWRMRYVHAAKAGIVTCCDEADARRMPEDYRHSRIRIETRSDEQLAEIAANQHLQLMDSAWDAARAVEAVDGFVKSLV